MLKKMSEFTENQEIYRASIRGTYIIFPLKYSQKLNLTEVSVDNAHEEAFVSSDWSDLLVQKCKRENGFVKRFILDQQAESIRFEKKAIETPETYSPQKDSEVKAAVEIPVEEVQLFVFDNGIAMLSMLLVYENAQIPYIYEFINPGYVND